jgi:xylulokinase
MKGNVRAIIESQLLSMRLHSAWIKNRPKIITATGGASVNKEILQIAANIFDANILQFNISNSAVLGATFRAIQSYFYQKKKEVSWDTLIEKLLMKRSERIISPQETFLDLYDDMVNLYEACENFILHNGKDPQPLRDQFLSSYFGDKNV